MTVDRFLPSYGVLTLRIALGTMYLAHSLVLKLITFGLPGTAGYFVSVGSPGLARLHHIRRRGRGWFPPDSGTWDPLGRGHTNAAADWRDCLGSRRQRLALHGTRRRLGVPSVSYHGERRARANWAGGHAPRDA
jgi:hypothetical protein